MTVLHDGGKSPVRGESGARLACPRWVSWINVGADATPHLMRTIRIMRKLLLFLALVPALYASPAASDTDPESDRVRPGGWTIHLDNDLFAFTRKDYDYTAGLSVTLGGYDAAGPKPFAKALNWLDKRTGFGPKAGPANETLRSFEAGLLLFTPRDLDAFEPLVDDRPYANLAYVSISRLTHRPGTAIAYQSSLTLGVLGLPLVEQLHRALHTGIGSRAPNGYAHQISRGGEPTARYAVTRYHLLDSGRRAGHPYHLRLGLTGAVGYLTEAAAELELRWGSANTPWWSSTPLVTDYAGHPPIRLAGGSSSNSTGLRFQLSTGILLRARAYNAFLQGQFRTSDVTHPSSHLNNVLAEAWLGVTMVLPNDLSINYTLRHQTEELRTDDGARALTWGGISISQQF